MLTSHREPQQMVPLRNVTMDQGPGDNGGTMQWTMFIEARETPHGNFTNFPFLCATNAVVIV